MQQTKTYKLNLIETSDTFSPNPLNENMEKVEAALGGVKAELGAAAAAGADADAALEQRVIALEGHKVAAGAYTGNGGTLTIKLGFTPIAVIVQPNGNYPRLAVRTQPVGGATIVDGGLQLTGTYLNGKDNGHTYFAIC